MSIAVIGANGFLGQSLIKFFIDEGHNVTAFSRTPITMNCPWEEFNINKSRELDHFTRFTHVFYAAAAGTQRNLEESNDMLFVNALFPIMLSDALSTSDTKLITFGSYFEIGNNVVDKEWTEEEIVFSKNAIEGKYIETKKLLSYYAYSSKLIFHFVLPTIYGEHENQNRLIPYLVNNLKVGSSLTLSEGSQIRQYVYVNDAIKFIWAALVNGILKGVYNSPYAECLTIKSLTDSVGVYFDTKAIILESANFRDLSMPNLQLKSSIVFDGFSFGLTKISDNLPKYLLRL